jgi:subtilase family serine protease
MLKRPTLYASVLPLLLFLVLGAFTPVAHAAGSAAPQIVAPVNETDLVQLAGSTHPLALAKFDRGAVADSLAMEHMYVMLRRSSEQESSVEHYIAALHDPHSASYHRWLTADELGRKFGPAQEDIDTVVSWLRGQGFTVNLVHKSGLTIDVSGTAGQVRNAFHTEIHQYDVNGEAHIANSSDPKIPAALAPVVVGVASLNDFMPKPMLVKPQPNLTIKCTGCPDGFDNTVQYLETPPDFATIYNATPLYTGKTPITGKGQTVVVLEISDILSKDVATFRKAFGLSSFSGTFTQIHPGPGCSDPGINGEFIEASLDAEWAGAVAPDANVKLASCASTATGFGAFIAAQNLLDSKTPPPIMSLSFGGCEAAQGPAVNASINAMWQQADAEGVSVFVSSGDGSAAGCDDFDTAQFAVSGIAANAIASTAHNVATGGTDFMATILNASTFWSASNTATGRSAKSYIPEMPWNDSCASNILAGLLGFPSGLALCNSTAGQGFLDIVGGSGAPSMIYPKPSWQSGIIGNPNDGARDLPDISLFASNGFYFQAIIFCASDASQGGSPCDYSNPVDVFFNSAGGTSFTAPQFASIQALINQKAGEPQGNPDSVFYALHKAEFGVKGDPNQVNLAGCNSRRGTAQLSSCIFHDITLGNNDVPCYGTNNCFNPAPATDFGVLSTSDSSLRVAYPSQTGWDFTSGLGSVNLTNLVTKWP